MDKNLMSHISKDMAMLTDDEQKMAELIEVLKPWKTVTTLMSSKTTPTTSMILPLKEMIFKSMAPGDEAAVKEAKAAIALYLEQRYTDPDLQKYPQNTTAWDPRFKSLPFLNEPSFVRLYRDLATEILEHEPQRQA
ncbi:E3 SUMO-protein ligase ZBED1-like [Cheilinus undulatus]|uniref:E3 SUMO-protein ligase ZBED1-like n=1 Tax=Cheilinus undulatus TaxID=241271 RepID=UPI001BD49FB5|nr:E3 SUMO-protein ligase ZBED1-like [Cheilinus undulatus]